LPTDASPFDTLVKVVVNCPPTDVTTPTMTAKIPAAMSPYSIAVAADSFLIKRRRQDIKSFLVWLIPCWPTRGRSLPQSIRRNGDYLPLAELSPVEMLVNVVDNCPPIEVTIPIIATEIPAAMSPYSIAVAADSFLIRRRKQDIKRFPIWLIQCWPSIRSFSDGL
jgi:hypothetical protein